MEETSHPELVEGSSQAAAAPVAPAMEAKAKDTRLIYEVGFHVVPTVEEAQVGDVVQKIRGAVEATGAEIIGEQFPAKISLAYVVERAVTGKREKFSEAYFGWIKFAVESREGIPALEEKLRSTKEVLRSLLVESAIVEAAAPRRAVFSSNRLEGETIKKPTGEVQEGGEVSETELDKSIDALVGQDTL